LRVNQLRRSLASGKIAVGTFVGFGDPAIAEVAGLRGFDWVHIDAEHDGVTVPACYDFVRAADAVGIGTVVRVPRADADVILAYAETGVNGLLAPHVNSPEVAAQLVSAIAFPPNGTRGVAVNSRAANYGVGQSGSDYLRETTSHALPIALIEDDVDDDTIDAIVATSGLDVFAVGQGDLAASMGFPGEPSHERVRARVAHIADGVTRAGKHLLLPATAREDIQFAVGLGATLLVTNAATLLGSAMSSYLGIVSEVVTTARAVK
jgi:2-keto-3-deoxy-L-rhamnonate aldolase RhmA